MSEDLQVYLLWAAMAAALISAATFILNFFVALKSPPKKRATLVVGIAYLAATLFLMIGGVDGYRASAPLFALPGAVVAYWYWHGDYKARWYESAEHLPDGVALANDDWRAGLLLLGALFAAALVKYAARHFPL